MFCKNTFFKQILEIGQSIKFPIFIFFLRGRVIFRLILNIQAFQKNIAKYWVMWSDDKIPVKGGGQTKRAGLKLIYEHFDKVYCIVGTTNIWSKSIRYTLP